MESTYVFIALAFLATLAREIVKDVEDMDADRGHRQTLPMSIGPTRSIGLASMAASVAIIISPFPLWLYGFGATYFILIFLVDFIFVYACLKAYSSPRTASKLLKIGMLLALLAFIAGALGV